MKDSGFLSAAVLSCAFVLWASACTPLSDPPFPPTDPDAALGDAASGSPPPGAPSHIVQSSGQLRGRSEKFQLQLSAGMPQPTGAGDSRRFRLLLGAEAPYGKAGRP